jgi:hypothetical protein
VAWRHFGWISLFVLILMAACGPTTVTDINGDGVSDDDDDVSTGDDDDDAATTFPTGTTPPGAAATLTNVPSFATWDSTIRPLGCVQCHTGGSGGLYMNPGDAANKKYYWFSSICNRDSGALNEGMQSYSPAAGRFQLYMRGNEPAGHTAIGNNAAAIDAWLAQGGATVPPSCNDYYDLANSN